MKKAYAWILVAGSLFLIGLFTFAVYEMHSSPELPDMIPYVRHIPETSLDFVGDIMLARSVRTSVEKNFGGNYDKLFENVGELQNADILFGNLEGALSDKGADLHHLYSFRMATTTAGALQRAGFDALSIANNHVGDWGRAAFSDTLARVAAEGIAPVGGGTDLADASAPRILVRNGVKFGFLGATDVGPDWLAAATGTPGILLASDPTLPEIIRAAAAKVDVLIVSVHWGEEYHLEANARQIRLAHMMIDSGAKLVIGTHPHVREQIEEYKDGLIAYSLGNFIFDQFFSPEVIRGDLLQVKFSGKNLVSHTVRTVNISSTSQPSLE